jgi:hypothetical protein
MKLNDIEHLLSRAIDHLRLMGIDEVGEPERDYYLTYGNERFDVVKKPEPAVGSLCDDIRELESLISNGRVPSAVDIDRLAEVLHWLSDKVSGDV